MTVNGVKDAVDRAVTCPGCGAELWLRSADLPAVSGTLPQVRPGGECLYCGYDGGFQ